MSDQELIEWYKRVFDEYPSVGLLAFIHEVMEQAAANALEQAAPVSAMEQPDWDDAPSWSNWWTVEPDGNINWHENEPQVVFYYWRNEGRMQRVAGGFIDIPIGTDWRQLKAQRPATAAGEGE